MEMVLKCVLRSMEETNKHIDALGRQMKKTQLMSRRSFGLAMMGAGLAVIAYIRTKELEERVSAIEELLDGISEETYEEENEMEE